MERIIKRCDFTIKQSVSKVSEALTLAETVEQDSFKSAANIPVLPSVRSFSPLTQPFGHMKSEWRTCSALSGKSSRSNAYTNKDLGIKGKTLSSP